jgi:hypothetical protein
MNVCIFVMQFILGMMVLFLLVTAFRARLGIIANLESCGPLI